MDLSGEQGAPVPGVARVTEPRRTLSLTLIGKESLEGML